MSDMFADLVVIDGDPLELETRYSAQQIRHALERLIDVAAKIGERERWLETQLLGGAGAPLGDRGVLLSAAPFAGVGYWRDNLVEPPEAITRRFASMLDELVVQGMIAEGRLRRREQETLDRIVAAASSSHDLRLLVRTDLRSADVFTFEGAVRRRIAYALAFEASLAAGSRAPYEDLYPVLVEGSAEQLAQACPPPTDRVSFSIFLNLMFRLNLLVAHRRAHGVPPAAVPAEVRAPDEKRAWLADTLAKARTARAANVGPDGRVALEALMAALGDDARLLNTFFDGLPPWGELPDSARYHVRGDLDEPLTPRSTSLLESPHWR